MARLGPEWWWVVDGDELDLIVENHIEAGLGPDDVFWDEYEALADAWGVSVFEAYVADQTAFQLDDLDHDEIVSIFMEDGAADFSSDYSTADDILDEFGEL